MLNKKTLAAIGITALLASGCATTGRNYQTDIDAMNAKLAAMQAQLNQKEEELARVQDRLREEEAARMQAESERSVLAQKLETASRPAPVATRPDSDLK